MFGTQLLENNQPAAVNIDYINETQRPEESVIQFFTQFPGHDPAVNGPKPVIARGLTQHSTQRDWMSTKHPVSLYLFVIHLYHGSNCVECCQSGESFMSFINDAG